MGAHVGAHVFFATALLCTLAGPAGAQHVGRGDFDFHLDSAAFRGHDHRDLTHVFVRIPNHSLRFKEAGKAEWATRVKFSYLLTDDAGKEIVKQSETMTFSETDASRVESSLAFQTVIKQFHLAPGGYWLSVSLENLDAPKISIIGLIKDKNKTSMVRRARLNLPEIPEDEPSFSTPLFVWTVDPREQGIRKYQPNAARMYGLYKDTLSVYVELYLPDSMAKAPSFEFRTDIVDAKGESVRETKLTLPNPAPEGTSLRTYPVLLREDLTTLAAGTYSLYLSFGLDGETIARVKSGDFSVAWDLRTWEIPRREYLAEARFLLGDDEFKAFQEKSPGEQEQVLDALWKSFDPSPDSGGNEAYDLFVERMAYINAHFSERGPAVMTPQGDIYLRYGPPDELVQDVIPLNYETLLEAEMVVDDPFHPMNFSSVGSKQYTLPVIRNTISGGSSNARSRPEDNTGVPYELWIYVAGGEPMLKRDKIQQMDVGMRFLFVDRDGHGVYTLERSSTISDK
ncbi:MAG TPA: GWxTD domain-containing protein [Candidatus Krumholzibacteria bacterium]|nr:GWxTD domain-containing protein [Candidatus Krumholzibacteria bacterium]